MKKVVVIGDSFAGDIRIGDSIVSISGKWVSSPQSSTIANGKPVVVEGSVGTYFCPSCKVEEEVEALSSSSLEGINGKKLHLLGDSVKVKSHENISVVSISGQDNVKSV